jgi:hypothetical protein
MKWRPAGLVAWAVAMVLPIVGHIGALAQTTAPPVEAPQAQPAPADQPAAQPAQPTPPPAPPAEQKPADQKPPQNIEQIEPATAAPLLGKKVRDASGKNMGLVVDVLVDADGTVRAAVIDFGGFLGVGSRKIAIDRRLLQFNPADHETPIVAALNRAEVQAAPEFKPSSPAISVVGPPPVEDPSPPPGDQ